jgi:hypothetical protein
MGWKARVSGPKLVARYATRVFFFSGARFDPHASMRSTPDAHEVLVRHYGHREQIDREMRDSGRPSGHHDRDEMNEATDFSKVSLGNAFVPILLSSLIANGKAIPQWCVPRTPR